MVQVVKQLSSNRKVSGSIKWWFNQMSLRKIAPDASHMQSHHYCHRCRWAGGTLQGMNGWMMAFSVWQHHQWMTPWSVSRYTVCIQVPLKHQLRFDSDILKLISLPQGKTHTLEALTPHGPQCSCILLHPCIELSVPHYLLLYASLYVYISTLLFPSC